MQRTPPLSEASMLAAEARIPELAAEAGRRAHERALRQPGAVILTALDGQLVEQRADGGIRVLKQLPSSTPVREGARFTRKPGSAALRGHGRW
ncbi:hypothetical protein M4R22_06285 [Acidovorax sp. GBBC 3334]|uniref:hypothetical protein n=1 Tax=Acidovorax sp. GBBC 3334 TaxID=2940496 RepID=UPI0023048C8C|nr:hypothetical protein [Acidovorax sp. GBBC 3334]MDA8454360.1 hypothetical protein [Acidovorax sp. GBBC 3334]